MPTEQDFLVFAGATGSNVLSQAAWAALGEVTTGFTSGILPSTYLNKALRQSSIIAAVIADFIVQESGQPAIDDGTTATLLANFISSIQNVGRIVLSAPLNLYVSPTGNDANNGLSPSFPFLTIGHAIGLLQQKYDLRGNAVTINIADGTYTGGVGVAGPILGALNQSSITFLGNVSTPANVIINVTGTNCFAASNGAEFTISGMTLQASGTGVAGHALLAGLGGFINVSTGIVFGACTVGHVVVTAAGTISIPASYQITGGAGVHWSVDGNGSISISGALITLTGLPAFTNFATGTNCGVIEMVAASTTFSGSAATGTKQYTVGSNGVINTVGATLPGSVAGTTGTGGQYL